MTIYGRWALFKNDKISNMPLDGLYWFKLLEVVQFELTAKQTPGSLEICRGFFFINKQICYARYGLIPNFYIH